MAETEGIRFILKYGFIILVIMFVFLVLNKFGLFTVLLAPESCNVEEGFDCISFTAHKDGVNLILQNLHDFDVAVSKIEFKNCLFNGRTNMPRGIVRPFLLKDCILSSKIKDDLIISYYTPDNVLHQVHGSLVVSIE